jgi:hypothetical protein
MGNPVPTAVPADTGDVVRASRAEVGRHALQDFEWSGRVGQGKSIEIKGINGGVFAEATDGDEVRVTVEMEEGRRGYADEISFEVLEHENGVTICAMYPSDRRREPNECRAGSRGRMNIRDNDTKVEFTVRVPKGVNFVGRTVNGSITAESLDGDVEAHTVNGRIEVSTNGFVQATTVNGSIRASLGRADWTGSLEFETVNGSITVELPDGVGADVTARTLNGGIDTDFPLTISGRFSSRRLTGTIGGGGRRMRLETINGAVRILRRN